MQFVPCMRRREPGFSFLSQQFCFICKDIRGLHKSDLRSIMQIDRFTRRRGFFPSQPRHKRIRAKASERASERSYHGDSESEKLSSFDFSVILAEACINLHHPNPNHNTNTIPSHSKSIASQFNAIQCHLIQHNPPS